MNIFPLKPSLTPLIPAPLKIPPEIPGGKTGEKRNLGFDIQLSATGDNNPPEGDEVRAKKLHESLSFNPSGQLSSHTASELGRIVA